MRVLLGIFLVATALALPVPETDENKSVPLVITDYSSVAKSEESNVRHDSSESSEESSEKPSEEAPRPTTEQAPVSDEKSSEESGESKPLQDSDNSPSEEPPRTTLAPAPLKIEEKPEEQKEAKQEILIPETKKIAEEKSKAPVPAVKLIESSDIVEAAKNPVAVAEEPKQDLPLEVTTENEEKPLALPQAEIKEVPASKAELSVGKPELPELKPELPAAKSESPLPTEPKIEAAIIKQEEKLVELKNNEPEKKNEKVEEKKEILDEKKGKSDEEIATTLPPLKVENNAQQEKVVEALPEKLPEPSASS